MLTREFLTFVEEVRRQLEANGSILSFPYVDPRFKLRLSALLPTTLHTDPSTSLIPTYNYTITEQ